jgi:hypothetical protein
VGSGNSLDMEAYVSLGTVSISDYSVSELKDTTVVHLY